MGVSIEIGSLISRQAGIRGGRPCVAGTGVSVRRMKMVNVDVQDVLEAARPGQGLRSMDEIAYAVLDLRAEGAPRLGPLDALVREPETSA
jgi:uncharacterized protein (DUF433 family)